MDDYSNNNILRINISDLSPDFLPSGCGYCKDIITGVRKQTSYKYRLNLNSIPIDIFEDLVMKGWSRCGGIIYKTSYEKTCCKLYQPRVNINNFVISNEQKKIMKRFKKFLSGEYEENKFKSYEKKMKKLKLMMIIKLKLVKKLKIIFILKYIWIF
jgi:arginyl-tRNA--protein-N-Asp/Glu arginylyltransferase